MSRWQFSAAIGGVIKANGGGDDRLGREDADRLADLIRKNR